MKFVISSALLSSRLTNLGRVIGSKNKMPILDCFLFEIEGLRLTVTASDGDSYMKTFVELTECDANIRFAVNAQTMLEAVKAIPEQPIQISVEPESYEMKVVYQNGIYELLGEDADVYPVPSEESAETVELSLACSTLGDALTRGLAAAATDAMRPQLSSVCLDVNGGSLSVVGTNGNHLALTKAACSTYSETEGTYLLSARAANVTRNILGGEGRQVKVSLSARTASFITDDFSFECRLVEGRYPNYKAIIPMDNTNELVINRAGLVGVLRRVLAISGGGEGVAKFLIENSTATTSYQDIDFRTSSKESILCEYSGVPLRIAFKGKSLLELIQNMDSEDITMKIADASRAVLIHPTEQKEKEETLALIMPSFFFE